MFKSNSSRLACLLATGVLAASVTASSAAAEPETQEGLVNVNVSGVTILVPVSVAANICDVNVNVLAGQLDAPAACNADADSTAITVGGNEPAPDQDGLVNVNISDVVVEVPIGVAANICDVNVNVLAEQIDSPTVCKSDGDSIAIEGP